MIPLPWAFSPPVTASWPITLAKQTENSISPGAGIAGSGALSGAAVGAPRWVTPQEQLPCSQQGPFPSLERGAPSQALSRGTSQGGKGCPPGTGTAGWWHRAGEAKPPAWVCKKPLFSCGSETAPSPCAQVIMPLDFCCLTLLLCHIQAAAKLPSKLCQTI